MGEPRSGCPEWKWERGRAQGRLPAGEMGDMGTAGGATSNTQASLQLRDGPNSRTHYV
jgi:hypothetical protein